MRVQAEKALIEKEENKEYLPIQGLAAFCKATAQLLLGSSHPAIKEVPLKPLKVPHHLDLGKCETSVESGRRNSFSLTIPRLHCQKHPQSASPVQPHT